MPDDMRFLTIKEIAAVLRVHASTVRRFIRTGRLVSVKVGSSVRIRREDFVAFLAAHTRRYRWRLS